MIKVSRKSSADPVQEKLRQHKAVWNKEVSAFIDNLIHFKKMMNGWPSKFLMERASIGEALPKDPNSILGVLASDFSELATDGHQVIEEQAAYAKTRRRKKPLSGYHELPPAGETKAPAPSGLAAALSLEKFEEYELMAEGSGRISRFVSRFRSPRLFGSAAEKSKKRNRLILLSNSAKVSKLLSRMQQSIVGQTEGGILTAIGFIDDAMSIMYSIFQTLQNYIDLERYTAQFDTTKTEQPENVSHVIGLIEKARKEFKDFDSKRTSIEELNEFSDDIGTIYSYHEKMNSYLTIKDVENASKNAKELSAACEFLLSKLNNKFNQQASSFEQLNFTKKTSSQQINIVAENILYKWIGKGIHHLSPFDRTSNRRIEIYRNIAELRRMLNDIMNKLEKDFEPQSLNREFKTIEGGLQALRRYVYTLKGDVSPETAKKIKEKEDIQKEERARLQKQRLYDIETERYSKKLTEKLLDKERPSPVLFGE